MSPKNHLQTLDHTLAFIRDLDRARNLDDISTQVLRHIQPFGVEFMAATTVPKPGMNPRQQRGHVLLNRWPEDWLKRYAARGYAFRDPAFARAMSNPAAFFWKELESQTVEDPMAWRIMEEGAEFGLKEGFTASLITLDGQRVIWSLGGPHLDINADTRAILTLIASYATARAIVLKEESPARQEVHLSAREREALQWAAEGKNDWEIGEVMNISEHGADKHMRSIRAKLGAINRTQAVAEAIRRGLIT